MTAFTRWLMLVAAVACTTCGRVNYDDAGPGDVPREATDHDEDDVVDAIDNCPAHFNQSQADDDRDGVGNACDPRPSAPGDKLVGGGSFAAGFNDWTPDSPQSWSFTSGAITTTAPADTTLATITLMETVNTPTLYTAFRVDDYGVNFSHYVQLGIGFVNNTWACNVVDGSNGTGMLDFVELLYNGALANTAAPALAVPPGATTAMALTRQNDGASCTALGASAAAPAIAMPGGVANIRIAVVGLKATLQYAVVYDVP